MKKILLLILGIFPLFVLGACSSEQNFDGYYREYYEAGGGITISDIETFEIKGDILIDGDDEYFLDKEKSVVLDNGSGGVKPYSVDESTGVISYKGYTFVKVDSEYWDELVKNGAKVLDD